MAHARLSPSAATRWMNCPGSIRLCEKVPPKAASKYASEGTAAHYLAEKCLQKGEDAAPWIGRKITVREDDVLRRFEVDAEMADAVQVYLDEVRAAAKALPGAAVQTEGRVDLTPWIPEGFGTADHTITQPLGKLVVHDLKYGKGVPVEVEGNTQMKIYALGRLGAGNPRGVEVVETVIVQPRAPHADGPIRRAEYSAEELLRWGRDVLRPAAERTRDPDAPLAAGTWCRWCDALDVCPETRKKALASAGVMFGPGQNTTPKLPDVETLTIEKKAEVYTMVRDFIAPWWEAVQESFKRDLESIGPACGFKLVAGRSSRSWEDPARAELEAGDILGDGAYAEPKLLSPAQMEKELKKQGLDPNALAHLIVKKQGAPTLAPVTDKRPALPPKAEQMFGEGA